MGRTSDVSTSVKIFENFFRAISTFLTTFPMFSRSRNPNPVSDFDFELKLRIFVFDQLVFVD